MNPLNCWNWFSLLLYIFGQNLKSVVHILFFDWPVVEDSINVISSSDMCEMLAFLTTYLLGSLGVMVWSYSYLLDLIPPTIQSTTIYPLRNGNDIIFSFCRLSLTRDSFVSATVREWNNLNHSVRNLDSLSKFKKATRSSISMPIPRLFLWS
jgi:hypothetical protein